MTNAVARSLVAMVMLAMVPHAFAQGGPLPVIQDGTAAVLTMGPAPRTPSGKPDLSGVWAQPSTDENAILQKTLPPFRGAPPQLTPWASERYEYNRDARQAPPALGAYAEGFGGRRELNTILKCMPAGAPYLIAGWGSVSPSEIIQTDKRVLIFYEFDHNIRQIWTDGRKHPDFIDPSWVGHSIGRWEGDTLIVETVGIRPEPWLNSGGHVASDGLRIEERYRRIDSHTMEIMFTLDDPKAFVKPWTRRVLRRLRPTWEVSESTNVRCYPGSEDQSIQKEFFDDLFLHH
jgi:hypothetical protein